MPNSNEKLVSPHQKIQSTSSGIKSQINTTNLSSQSQTPISSSTTSTQGKPSASTAWRPHPCSVGNSFVKQYYHLLSKSPELLHRFYKDESRFSRCEGSQMIEAITGQKNINDKILSIGYDGAMVDIESGSVDCQSSLEGGVFVMVTGIMTLKKDNLPRPFVQSFFLAVQPKGFFVLNDSFRFTDSLSRHIIKTEPINVVQTNQPSEGSIQQQAVKTLNHQQQSPIKTTSKKPEMSPQGNLLHSPKQSMPVSPTISAHEKTFSPKKMENPEDKINTLNIQSPKSVNVWDEKQTTEYENSPKKDTRVVGWDNKDKDATNKKISSSSEHFQQTVKKPTTTNTAQDETWAAKLFSGGNTVPNPLPSPPQSQGSSFSQAPTTKKSQSATSKPTGYQSTSSSKFSSEKGERLMTVPGGAASLYICNLPAQTTQDDLMRMFNKYGAIANINLNVARDYAFIDYTTVESMKSAVAENREFTLYDKVLHVEERNAEKKGSGHKSNISNRGGRDRDRGGVRGKGDRYDKRDGSGGTSGGQRRDNNPKSGGTLNNRRGGGNTAMKQE